MFAYQVSLAYSTSTTRLLVRITINNSKKEFVWKKLRLLPQEITSFQQNLTGIGFKNTTIQKYFNRFLTEIQEETVAPPGTYCWNTQSPNWTKISMR